MYVKKVESNETKDITCLCTDLNSFGDWSRKWLLSFNENKCVVLRLRKAVEFIYHLNNVPLQEVTSQKDLGVHVSNNLHPRTHIHEIVKSASKRIGLIKRCFTNRHPNTITLLYKSIVRSVIEYGSPVWAPWHKKRSNHARQYPG